MLVPTRLSLQARCGSLWGDLCCAVLCCAVLGCAAGKPVMEGKAVLFKKFADLDAFDLELNCDDPVKLVGVVCSALQNAELQ